MKVIFILCGVILLGAAAIFVFAHSERDHYGNEFRGYPAADLGAMADHPQEFLKRDLTIRGTITRQCPSSGCWFFLRDVGSKELKVEMGDTTPKLPQRIGRTATVEGRLISFGESFEFVGTAVEFR